MVTQTRMRPLLLRMQAVLAARRVVARTFPPVQAAMFDVQLRAMGAWLVAEMQRVEGRQVA